MSKIIEALEKVRDFAAKTEEPAAAGSAANAYQNTQQELADVYFNRSGKAPQALPGPTLVRVVERPSSYFWPWVVTTGALVLTALGLFTSGRIHIVIETPGGSAAERRAAENSGPAFPIALENFYFSDAAAPQSTRDGKTLFLAGGRAQGPVYAAAAFQPPFDADGYELEFEAKGRTGGETLEAFFRDGQYRTSLNGGPLRPFPVGVDTKWEKVSVPVVRSENFDASRIALLRIEAGPGRGGNSGAGVWLRNFRWKAHRNA